MFYADISNPNSPVFTQLTNTAVNNASADGTVSGNGTKLTLSTSEDLTGMNPDGSREFFIFDVNNLVVPFGQLTDDPTNSGSITSTPIINRFGSRVAFTSSENYIPPGNNPNGGRQLFLSQISYNSPNPPVSQLYQLTNFPNNDFSAFGPAITPDGNNILFCSNFKITGMNPDENPDLFIVDVSSPASPVFTQITRSNQFTATTGIINSTASAISFITSNSQFSRGGDQIILANLIIPNSPQFISLTNFPPDAEADDLSSPPEFTLIAFGSDTDLIPGGNTDGSEEIYILYPDDCGFEISRSAIPTLSQWGVIAMAGVLGIIGLLAIRKRKVTA